MTITCFKCKKVNPKEKEQEEESGVHSNYTEEILSLGSIPSNGTTEGVGRVFCRYLEKYQHPKGLRLLSH